MQEEEVGDIETGRMYAENKISFFPYDIETTDR